MTKLLQIEPQSARGTFNESMWDDPEWVAEEKYDGDRRIAQFVGAKFYLTGRRKSVKDGLFIDKAANVPHIAPSARNMMMLQGRILDGEICLPLGYKLEHGEPASKYVTSIMGSKPEEATRKQKERGWLRYVVFDEVGSGKQWERRNHAVLAVGVWHSPHVTLAHQPAFDKQPFYNRIIANGGEGVILKNTQALYGDDSSWVKVKREATADVVIIGYKPPKATSVKRGDPSGAKTPTKLAAAGLIGAIEFGQYPAGRSRPEDLKPCGFCSGMDDAARAMFTAHQKKYIGQVMEIKHNGREPTGKFRHPRFIRLRPDKDPRNCVYRKDEI